jgi:hypothetical protein
MLIHGANLWGKEKHKRKYKDDKSRQYLAEIRTKYDEWHSRNMALVGPRITISNHDKEALYERVTLLEDYKNFLDQQHYAETFDSRSNLHSSVLEEFLYYLFKDLVEDFGVYSLFGKSHTFKDIFFVAPNYYKMLQTPHGRIEKKDHDFVIGVRVQASLQTVKPRLELFHEVDEGSDSQRDLVADALQDEDVDLESQVTVPVEELSEFNEEVGAGDAEIHLFDIPSIAIECKTYLDKTMLEGSSRAAEELKGRNPNGLYIVVMEWIKLSEAVNLRKYKVDQIYVLRKQKNTDREYRFLEGYSKNLIDPEVVWHLFPKVRAHLTTDWTGGVEHGLKRGWLID